MCKVSIIIAAYNIENYIERCLESVMNQTLKDIEIIIVNDGSTDNTLSKINEIIREDKRVKVINKKNAGLIEARKSGFRDACGEYILFLDGDDWIDLNTTENLYRVAKNKNYDIVCYSFKYAYEDGLTEEYDLNIVGEVESENFLSLILKNKILTSIWSKFIKREFLINNKITFPENITYAEDLALSCAMAIKKPKVYVTNNKYLYYLQRSNSITNTISDKIFDIDKVILFIRDILISNNRFAEYRNEFEFLIYKHNFIYRLQNIVGNDSKYNVKLYDNWKKYNININSNKYIIKELNNEGKWNRIGIKLLDKSYGLGKIYFILINSMKNKNRNKG